MSLRLRYKRLGNSSRVFAPRSGHGAANPQPASNPKPPPRVKLMEELTPKQIRERDAYEAEKAARKLERRPESTRDYLRRQAGWPPLKVK